MKLLETIQFEDFTPEEIAKLELRQAARAILLDNNDKIALLYVSKNKYHKLPGGGIEQDEDIVTALKRECLEETGCQIFIKEELGLIVEYRKRFNLKQESYCYITEVEGVKGTPTFEKGEMEEGFQLIWVSLDEATNLLTNEFPDDYEGKFIVKRDSLYLRKAKELFGSK